MIKHYNGIYEPPKCWVGDSQKICYSTREEAELAARVAEYDHDISNLAPYKCEYGDHWHLTHAKNQNNSK